MTKHISIPEELAPAGFSTAEAELLGLSKQRLRGNDLARPFHGVRIAKPVRDHVDLARAYLPLLRPGQAFGEHTAAAILGIPHPEALHRRGVVVVTERGESQIRRPRVLARRIEPGRLRVLDRGGLPVTSPELTWLMLGRSLTESDLVIAGDALIATASHYPGRGASALTSIDELGVELSSVGQVSGVGRLRSAYTLLRPGSESPRESLLRYLIVKRGIPEPELQFEHVDPVSGRVIGRSDMYWPFARVAGEYEGAGHREKSQWDRDIRKYSALERQGIVTVRATDSDLFPSASAWLDGLTELLARRG